VPTGGALLFHCLTYHASAPNTSRFKRRAPVYEYFAPTEQVALLPRQYDYGRSVRSATTA
jgi:ectoine hydroxylase-related dioxygenase (phytanoyl-CoA dioxygenase family)